MVKLDDMFSSCPALPGDEVDPLDPSYDVERMEEDGAGSRWLELLEASQLAEEYRDKFPGGRSKPRPTASIYTAPWLEREEVVTDKERRDTEILEAYADLQWRANFVASDDYLNVLPDQHPASSIDTSGHVPGPGGSMDCHLPQPTRPPKRKAEDQLFGRIYKIARICQGVQLDYSPMRGDGHHTATMAAIRKSAASDHCYAMPTSVDPGLFSSVAARDHWAAVIEPRLNRDRARKLRNWAIKVQYKKARREAYWAAWYRANDVIQAALGDLNVYQ